MGPSAVVPDGADGKVGGMGEVVRHPGLLDDEDYDFPSQRDWRGFSRKASQSR